jgi:hypothetical protein
LEFALICIPVLEEYTGVLLTPDLWRSQAIRSENFKFCASGNEISYQGH